MNRIKMAVWGINDAIWWVIRNSINPEKAEVVLFIDSDEKKQGVCYENIPIVAPSKGLFVGLDIDVCLITALSAYENIRKLLLTWGIETERIQPFITDEICKYSLGALDEIDRNFMNEVYFEPLKSDKLVDEYQRNYAIYLSSRYHGNADWVNQGSLISHACGGIVDGRQIAGSNSKEAFDYTVKSKFCLMECDVLCMKNGELILGHNLWRFYEAREIKYTIMTVKDLLKELTKHREIYCLMDVKWEPYDVDTPIIDYDRYRFVIGEIENLLSDITADEKERANLKSRIVMEVYDKETIKMAYQNNFHMFFTQYRNPDWMNYLNIVNLCCQYGIDAVGIDVENVDERLINFCKLKGIKIFAYSTNSIEVYARLRKAGIQGVFTDYLRPTNVKYMC